jgi:hypothetical protein
LFLAFPAMDHPRGRSIVAVNNCHVSSAFATASSSKLQTWLARCGQVSQAQRREVALAPNFKGRHRFEAANAAEPPVSTEPQDPPYLSLLARLEHTRHIFDTQKSHRYANMAGDPRALLRQVGHPFELSHKADN